MIKKQLIRGGIVFVITFFVLCLSNRFSAIDAPTRETTDTERDLHGTYEVVSVVDGDTLVISVDGNERKVRLIGVDTPESVHVDESKNTEEGKIASQYTQNLLMGEMVYLEYDVSPNDDYGRTLAYVYLDDGETMVNSLLIEEGMAEIMTIPPNCKYEELFADLQQTARENKKGFWNEK